jgi:hypothetical protein
VPPWLLGGALEELLPPDFCLFLIWGGTYDIVVFFFGFYGIAFFGVGLEILQ